MPLTFRILYSILLPVFLLLLFPITWNKARKRGGYRGRAGERYGKYTSQALQELKSKSPDQPRIWVHAVSVGETNVALKLLEKLHEKRADAKLILTVTTPTGHQVAEKFLTNHPQLDVTILYSPVDLPWVIRRAFRAIQPNLIVLMESELWPNWLLHAKALGIPVILSNARLSQRSARRYQKFKAFTSPLLALLDQVHVQEAHDIKRWEMAGLPPQRAHLTGSVKFDPENWKSDSRTETFERLLDQARLGRTSYPLRVLAASTHAGEELMLAQILAAINLESVPGTPRILPMIAPRHAERAPEIIQELSTQHFKVWRRSQPGILPDASPHAPIALIDSTGELQGWQEIADLVVIGKSFLAHGGQNPVEAAMAGKPVITGPHMENFPSITPMLEEHGALIKVQNPVELAEVLRELLEQEEKRHAMGQKTHQVIEIHRGATLKSVDFILTKLKEIEKKQKIT